MAASSRAQVLDLYRTMLRESKHFSAYSYRSYAIRRIRDAFRENKNVKDPVQIQALVNKAKRDLGIIRRQVHTQRDEVRTPSPWSSCSFTAGGIWKAGTPSGGSKRSQGVGMLLATGNQEDPREEKNVLLEMPASYLLELSFFTVKMHAFDLELQMLAAVLAMSPRGCVGLTVSEIMNHTASLLPVSSEPLRTNELVANYFLMARNLAVLSSCLHIPSAEYWEESRRGPRVSLRITQQVPARLGAKEDKAAVRKKEGGLCVLTRKDAELENDGPWQVPQLPPGLSYHVGANCVEGPKAVGAAKDVKISWEQPCSPHPTDSRGTSHERVLKASP
ncbi:hypothetical protein EI555_000894 [Monodon monoceros]|uniref:Complex 1 LYR protein domain-containing protein n=1 Tax=Monodon monoceros TaxID=40151 RepID=A0A4U1EST2_MONMO|nr:hypothetical protein EI555_000894 [Monodon monoceros]